jgi:transposase
MASEGAADTAIAKELGISLPTVGKWRSRYIETGIEGLFDLPRSGKPPVYDPVKTREAILSKLEEAPPKGQSQWDGKALANELDMSDDKVYRVLRAEGVCLKRRRSWCVSNDPNFAQKAADVVNLYTNPPEGSIVLSLDEKPSIQGIKRPTGYVRTKSGAIVIGEKSTYKRHGTLNLFAALEIASGKVITEFTERKRRVEFLEFMDKIAEEYPPEQEIHVIMGNYCIHKKCDAWLAVHPNFSFHYTPTSSS